MSDCCSSACQAPVLRQRPGCPRCGRESRAVSAVTLLNQLQRPWAQGLGDGPWYFCAGPDCDLVYFNAAGEGFDQARLRQPVGHKQHSEQRLLCYCFGVTLADYLADPGVRDFVLAQTKAGVCACASRNPSGRCCLADFPKPALPRER